MKSMTGRNGLAPPANWQNIWSPAMVEGRFASFRDPLFAERMVNHRESGVRSFVQGWRARCHVM
jgi:hypothetical protein